MESFHFSLCGYSSYRLASSKRFVVLTTRLELDSPSRLIQKLSFVFDGQSSTLESKKKGNMPLQIVIWSNGGVSVIVTLLDFSKNLSELMTLLNSAFRRAANITFGLPPKQRFHVEQMVDSIFATQGYCVPQSNHALPQCRRLGVWFLFPIPFGVSALYRPHQLTSNRSRHHHQQSTKGRDSSSWAFGRVKWTSPCIIPPGMETSGVSMCFRRAQEPLHRAGS